MRALDFFFFTEGKCNANAKGRNFCYISKAIKRKKKRNANEALFLFLSVTLFSAIIQIKIFSFLAFFCFVVFFFCYCKDIEDYKRVLLPLYEF